MANSIVCSDKKCYVCGAEYGLELHHIMFGNPYKKLSDRYGLTVYLCKEHHRGNSGVHFNKELNEELKATAQRAFEAKTNHRCWMEAFGRNYLNEEEWII